MQPADDTAVTAAQALEDAATGELVLGRYRLGRRLGAGGMGVVHLAHDEHLDRAVAVKRISAAGDGGIAVAKRAEREARAAARLQHPGIVALHEAAREGDTVYLVSELVRGHTFRELLDEGALSDHDVLDIGIVLCDALAHAHARGVVHRDVKPQNVLVPARPADPGGIAKLTDFGVALLLGDEALTMTGDVVGTLAYMAPEQAAGDEVTAATDLYSVALVVYEALTGVNPVRAAGATQTARRIGTRLPALGRLRRDLDLDLCRAIDRAVRPHPLDRGELEDLRAALAGALDEADDRPGTVAGPPTETVLTRVVARRAPREPVRVPGRIVAGLAAGAVAGLVVARIGPAPPVAPLAIAATVVVAVGLLPRLGWIAAALAAVVWLADAQGAGLAVLVAAAAAPVVLLVRRAAAWWTVPALAPVLGVVSLSVAFPVVAGQAPRLLARGALGLLGAWWLLLAEAATGERLLAGAPADVPVREVVAGDGGAALSDVVGPLLTGGGLLVGAVWALAAAVLPLVVRGRSAPVDLVAATAWAAALAAGTEAAAGASSGAPTAAVVPGAVVAGVLAVLACASRAEVRSPRDP